MTQRIWLGIANLSTKNGNAKTEVLELKKNISAKLNGAIEWFHGSVSDLDFELKKFYLDNKENAQGLCVVGGDGTLRQCLAASFQGSENIWPEKKIILIPRGRGNDFFKSLDPNSLKKKDFLQKSMTVFEDSTEMKVDAGFVLSSNRDPYFFLNVLSFGMGGFVVHSMHQEMSFLEQSLQGSSFSYKAATAKAFINFNRPEVRITIDDDVLYEGKILSGFILNGVFNGGGMRWAESIDLSDGLLSVLVFPDIPLWQTAFGASEIFTKGLYAHSSALKRFGKKITVTRLSPSHQPWIEADGEAYGDSELSEFSVEVLPGGGGRFLVPSS